MFCGNPVDGSLDLSAVKAGSALCLRIVGTVDHRDLTIFILLKAGACNEISAHEADLIPREQAEIFFRRLLHKVLTLNIKLSGERNLAFSHFRIFQVIGYGQHFRLPFRIVVDHQLHRIQDRHHSGPLKL